MHSQLAIPCAMWISTQQGTNRYVVISLIVLAKLAFLVCSACLVASVYLGTCCILFCTIWMVD